MTPEDEDQGRDGVPGRSNMDQDDIRRPYDTSDLEKVPRPTDEDPVYRPWWVL